MTSSTASSKTPKPTPLTADMVSAEPVNTDAVLSAEPNGTGTAIPGALTPDLLTSGVGPVTPAAEGLSPDTLDRVAGIADRARERNLDRAEELAGWVTAAEQGELTTDGRMVAAEVAHQLAGSAGTFGYQSATERAREVEAIFNHGRSAQSWERASDCIQAVIGELNQPRTAD